MVERISSVPTDQAYRPAHDLVLTKVIITEKVGKDGGDTMKQLRAWALPIAVAVAGGAAVWCASIGHPFCAVVLLLLPWVLPVVHVAAVPSWAGQWMSVGTLIERGQEWAEELKRVRLAAWESGEGGGFIAAHHAEHADVLIHELWEEVRRLRKIEKQTGLLSSNRAPSRTP